MDADTELNALIGRDARIALDHRALDFDRAARRIDHAAKLDDAPVAGALDHAAVVHGDGRIDQVAAERPQPRQGAILVRSGEPAVADDIDDQDRRYLSGLAHWGSLPRKTSTTRPSFVTAAYLRRGDVANRR